MKFPGILLLAFSIAWSVTYYVSPDGNDTNDGSEGSPFKTLHHARDALRTQSGAKEVIIRGGDYFLDEPLRFESQDGGTAQNPVIYKNYQGEEPRIFGGKRITGWQAYQGNIYRARLADNGITYTDSTNFTLSENGKRSVPAKHPNNFGENSGCNGGHRAIPSDLTKGNKVGYGEGEFPDTWETTHTTLNWACFGWFSFALPVGDVDFTNRVITLNPTFEDVGRPWHYWVEGSVDFVDRPTEWALDEEYIYYWPKSSDIDNQVIVLGTMLRILDFRGSSPTDVVSHIHVEGLMLSTSDRTKMALSSKIQPRPGNPNALNDHENNCEPDYSRHGIVHFENAEHCAVKYCKIFNAGIMGVMFNYHAQHDTVYGCWIEGMNVSFQQKVDKCLL